MKHINWNNIIRGVSAGMLLLAIAVGYMNYADAQGGSTASCQLQNKFLSGSGNSTGNGCAPGILDISYFELAPKAFRTAASNLGASGIFLPSGVNPIIFRVVGSAAVDSLAAFGNAGFGPTFVNYGSAQPFFGGDPELQVNGRIQIQTYQDLSAAEYRTGCVNDFGNLRPCQNQPASGGGGPTFGK